jgi:hypothetical protein
MSNSNSIDTRNASGLFTVYCYCGKRTGSTDCEVTSTTPVECDACHAEYLRAMEPFEPSATWNTLPFAGEHGDW